jgi:hypothetical protein
MWPQLNLNDIGRNCLLGNRKKIAKYLMRTFTCCSTFLYGIEHLRMMCLSRESNPTPPALQASTL